MTRTTGQTPDREREDRVVEEAEKRAPVASAHQLHRLATCCAFFKAEHYRPAGPDRLRQSDIEAFEAELGEVVNNCGCSTEGSDETAS